MTTILLIPVKLLAKGGTVSDSSSSWGYWFCKPVCFGNLAEVRLLCRRRGYCSGDYYVDYGRRQYGYYGCFNGRSSDIAPCDSNFYFKRNHFNKGKIA